MKVNSTIYKGIEFVEISTLPNEQKTSLLQTIDPDLLIKIVVDGKLLSHCLQYKDYEEWYDNSFVTPTASKQSTPVPELLNESMKVDLQV